MALSNPFPSVHTRTVPGPAPNGLGQGLFASTDINPGEDVLHIDTPFVAVLDTQRLTDTCSGCFSQQEVASGSELRACTGCRTVRYCNRTCQATDWKFAHSLECGVFSKLAPRVLPINARAMLRMVLRSARRKYTAAELDLFVQLEMHVRDMRRQNVAQWERIQLSSKAVRAYSGTEMNEEAVAAFGAKLDVNAFNLTTPLYDRIGLYLHPYAALINHSCASNAVVGFDGAYLTIKALRPIRQNEQIFISYVDATNPVDRRRTELRDRYFFDCSELREQVEKAYLLMEAVSNPGVEPGEAVDSFDSVARDETAACVVEG
ncbi:hypothetical protein FE257_012640 [Aspergillus nanangensis]|uniref:Suppressor of anucleate metulae protein B n=1 Tax=Aspergillus nanangensis TaxID=2582783 RepID=A0AAD4GRR6_ASPNN|nr:hypothetical protein FE257_012640 [Aspergillus nanangensis]